MRSRVRIVSAVHAAAVYERKIAAEKIRLLKTADNVFGLQDGKICVFAENPDKQID